MPRATTRSAPGSWSTCTRPFTVVVDLEPHEVETGETIDFRADHPHEYRNDGAEPALLTMVVVMPPGERDRSRR